MDLHFVGGDSEQFLALVKSVNRNILFGYEYFNVAPGLCLKELMAATTIQLIPDNPNGNFFVCWVGPTT
jgi:hypothetical protein